MANKTDLIEIDLPEDIIFAMKVVTKPEEIKKKLKIALSVFLFQEQSISLGRAIELAEISRVKFIEILKEHGISAYEYSEKDLERDQVVIGKCRKSFGK